VSLSLAKELTGASDFDSAPGYGDGCGEKRLVVALKERCDQIPLVAKVNSDCWMSAVIWTSVQASLRRL
jgi:aryl-alcohol dehydrogenase-like predicted oxidoreductase